LAKFYDAKKKGTEGRVEGLRRVLLRGEKKNFEKAWENGGPDICSKIRGIWRKKWVEKPTEKKSGGVSETGLSGARPLRNNTEFTRKGKGRARGRPGNRRNKPAWESSTKILQGNKKKPGTLPECHTPG